MDIKEIKALSQIFTAANLTNLEIEEEGIKIKMERQAPVVAAAPAAAMPVAVTTSAALPFAEGDTASAVKEEAVVDFNRMTEIKSPMVGVFYAAPSPDAPPYVKRGDQVKKGDVLCIIEAMKLMNELVAEQDGEIADICVENGQVVEFGQTMFKIC